MSRGIWILIHPFREGNGRLSRLLCDVLAVLAGKGLLDYSLWDEHKAFYFKGNTGRRIRELQPYDATGERHLARLTGEANGFRLCLIF
jgi:fido (protein-threonine AMPylation protein)